METSSAADDDSRFRKYFSIAWTVAKYAVPLLAALVATVVYHYPSLPRRAAVCLKSFLPQKALPDYWVRSVGCLEVNITGTSTALLADGSVILAGEGHSYLTKEPWGGSETKKALMVRLGPDGRIVWSRVYAFEQQMQFTKICPTGDGGVFAALFGSSGAAVARFDENGTMLWKVDMPEGYISHICQTHGGGVAFVGMHSDGKDGQLVWCGTLGNSGNLAWNRSLGEGFGASIEESTDHGFIVSATTDHESLRCLLVLKLDSRGTLQWHKFFDNPVNNCLAKSLATGGFLVAGSMAYIPEAFAPAVNLISRAFLIRLDDTGNIVWQNLYGSVGDNSFTGIQEADLGGFFVVGRRSYYKGDSSLAITLLQVDGHGGIEWQKAFAARKGDITVSDVFMSRDALFLAGRTSDFSLHPTMLVLKLRKDGAMPAGLVNPLLSVQDYAPLPFEAVESDSPRFASPLTVDATIRHEAATAQKVLLYSDVVAPPAPRIEVEAITRSPVKASGVYEITVNNYGTASLLVEKMFLEGGDTDSFKLSGTCNDIGPNDKCRVFVHYRGSETSTNLVVFSNDPARPVLITRIGLVSE